MVTLSSLHRTTSYIKLQNKVLCLLSSSHPHPPPPTLLVSSADVKLVMCTAGAVPLSYLLSPGLWGCWGGRGQTTPVQPAQPLATLSSRFSLSLLKLPWLLRIEKNVTFDHQSGEPWGCWPRCAGFLWLPTPHLRRGGG